MSKDDKNSARWARVVEKQKRRIRFETSVLLALVLLAGWGCSVALHRGGFHPLWARYLVCVLVAYALFVVLYWVWMKYIITDLSANRKKLEKEPSAGEKDKSVWDFDFGFFDGFDFEILGLFLGILAIAVVAVFVVFTAPAMLLDFVTTEAILVFVGKRVSPMDDKVVVMTILKNTAIPVLVLCGIMVVWAIILQACFPGQDSFSAVVVEFFRQRP